MERHDGYRIPLGKLSENEDNVSVMLPYGVFAVICPFNFPFALAVNMTAGALVTGNTVVLKPAEQTPWSTAPARRARHRGRPSARRAQRGARRRPRRVATLVDAADRRRRVHRLGRGRPRDRAHDAREPPLRPLIVEMGGKNPAIVTATADLDAAAAGIVRSAYGLSGQKCSSCSRVVVEPRRHDDAGRAASRRRAGELVLGDPAERRPRWGP